VGDERSRRAGAGPVTADERAGKRDRTRLAAGGDGIPFGLLAGRTRPALRPRQDVGSQPPGLGGDAPRIGAATGAGRQGRCFARHAVSGASGAHQRGALPANGRRFRRTGVDGAASGRVLSRLARRLWPGARTHPGSAEALRQGASASGDARQGADPDHGARATDAGASGIAIAEPRPAAAQDPRRNRAADRTPTTHRGDRNQPC
jgi:hypothetical protein